MRVNRSLLAVAVVTALGIVPLCPGQADKTAAMKADLVGRIDKMKDRTEAMVDTVFSFGELGFQEFETSAYLAGVLEKEGFKIERGIAGIPTAWMASWGEGKPVIALGSDIDGLPQTSQKPGVPWHEPLVAGAPGHGEGHNSGVPLNITAALAVKELMQRERLKGTLKLWPGVAEEALGGKAHYVRAGCFKDVDVVLFAHVASNLGVSWGGGAGPGLVSVEYLFQGESAHAGSAPWRGRSALDAVELMDVGWNFRREHLRLLQRSHYVITNGGDQPNVVPSTAAVWYFFREMDYAHIKELWNIGDKMAQGACLMTNTAFTSRVLGTAWPQHMNKPIAEAMNANIQAVGLPQWSADDQALAKAVQREVKAAEEGLAAKVEELKGPPRGSGEVTGGSDDIGDVSWVVPTVTLRYPANIPNLPGHHWASAIAMATPIAHKGVTAGAKVQALTVLDILLKPELVKQAWEYFNTVQAKEAKYQSLLRPEDAPPLWLNQKTMAEHRPQMKALYFNAAKYKTYLEQLGVKYPTLKK